MARCRKDAGQAIVVVALGMVVILGFLGLGFDLGYLRTTKRRLQMVADAAALSGATESSSCAGVNDCSVLKTAAQSALTENGFTGSTLVADGGGSCATSLGSNTLVVAVNNPPCYLGAADPHNGSAEYVEAIVAQKTPVFFATIFGYSSVLVIARGEAGVGNSSNCLYTLDTSSSAIDLSVSGGSKVSLPSCSMYVDSSNPTDAVSVTGGSTLSASSIDINGGYTVNGGSSVSPTPATGVQQVSDPLAYLPKPSVGVCVNSAPNIPYTVGGGATVNLTEGTYCGGISIGNGSTVTFGSGTYVMLGGGLTIQGGSTVTGSDVTFFLTGNSTYPYGPLDVSNGSNAQLIAPTSGTYVGILFFEDSSACPVGSACATNSNNVSNFTGGSSSYFQGALYFPTTPVVYSGGTLAQYTILDAYSVSVSGGSTATLNSNYSSLQGGSPIKGSGAILVE